MKTAARALSVMLLKYAAAVLFLHVIGTLSWLPAIAIAVLLPLNHLGTSGPVKQNFRPHQVTFSPHIGNMLISLGLMTDEEWKGHVQKPLELGKEWDCEELIRSGVRAVVLSTDADDEDMVHWTGSNYYTAGIGLRVDLEFLKFAGGMWDWSPSFFINPGRGGYNLGIRVRDDWWKTSEPRITALGIIKSVDREYQFGTTLLTLEVLPAAVFWPFYHGWSNERIAAAAKAAVALGWKVEDVGDADVGYFGERYSAQYADVWVRGLLNGY